MGPLGKALSKEHTEISSQSLEGTGLLLHSVMAISTSGSCPDFPTLHHPISQDVFRHWIEQQESLNQFILVCVYLRKM